MLLDKKYRLQNLTNFVRKTIEKNYKLRENIAEIFEDYKNFAVICKIVEKMDNLQKKKKNVEKNIFLVVWFVNFWWIDSKYGLSKKSSQKLGFCEIENKLKRTNMKSFLSVYPVIEFAYSF